jgi:hypothetical protein
MLVLASDSGAGTYLDWGVVHVSLTNAIIIGLMVVVFVAAIVIPFPRPRPEGDVDPGAGPGAAPGVDRQDGTEARP